MKRKSNQVSLEPYGYKVISPMPGSIPQPPKKCGQVAAFVALTLVPLIIVSMLLSAGYTSPTRDTKTAKNDTISLEPRQIVNDAVYLERRQKVKGNTKAGKVSSPQVQLVAKPWNDGMVHMWHGLGGYGDDPTHTDVSESAYCLRVDDEIYQIQDGGPPIYYYLLVCDGIKGYVEIDQTR